MNSPLFVLAVLGLNVAASEWLVRHTWLRHFGSALLVIVLTSITANIGLIPTYSGGSAIYSGIFEYVAPLAIFWLLLRVDLRDVMRAGLPMVSMFLLGSLGTLAGVIAGMWLVGGGQAFGELHYALGGMFVGTYTGGSINFNAIALEYGVVEDGALYAGSAVVDSAMTTVWMAVTVALPRLLARLRPALSKRTLSAPITGVQEDTETVHPVDLSILLALGCAIVWLSRSISGWIESGFGLAIPSILILTTFALVLAQFGWVQHLRGTRLTGMLAVMLFLAVIGALCDVSALANLGELGPSLMLFVTVIVLVHGLTVFGVSSILRVDPAVAAVASQANIGGGTSALALARSLGRADLVLPGILVGALGNGLGTYLGFLAAAWLR